jgi:putative hydrolase of the HAD superfamily
MRQPLWLFDLDNTLHDASSAIFPSINQAMTSYMARHLNLDPQTAGQLREHYWRLYGATLLGLVKHHSVDPHHFLHETHLFNEISGKHLQDLAGMVRGEKGLRQILNRLPGEKILLTNAPKSYALKVLKELGLTRCFKAVEAIEDMELHQQWRPKPDHLMIKRLLNKYRCSPQRAILVDDTLGHLLECSKLGIKTVWFKRHVRAYTQNRGGVSLEVQSIHHLFKSWRKLK